MKLPGGIQTNCIPILLVTTSSAAADGVFPVRPVFRGDFPRFGVADFLAAGVGFARGSPVGVCRGELKAAMVERANSKARANTNAPVNKVRPRRFAIRHGLTLFIYLVGPLSDRHVVHSPCAIPTRNQSLSFFSNTSHRLRQSIPPNFSSNPGK